MEDSKKQVTEGIMPKQPLPGSPDAPSETLYTASNRYTSPSV